MQPIPPQQLANLFQPGLRVYVPGCGGQSAWLDQWLKAHPHVAEQVTFAGVHIPGINRTDYAALHPAARMETIFLPPDLRASYNAGRVDYLPLPYVNTYRYYQTGPAFDLAFIQVAPPDANGRCSLGIAADFTPAVLENCIQVIALINPAMPATRGPSVPVERIDFALSIDAPLLTHLETGAIPSALERIADLIANEIRDGDTLQFGLGKLQRAILGKLHNHRQLRVHSGMISEPLLALTDAIADDTNAIRCGVALGSPALYDFCARDDRVSFAPVGETHCYTTLANIERLVCINSCIEVDLLGQVNAEVIHGQQVSGTGGLVDFARGARMSRGGKFILATPASQRDGQSRLVPRLGAEQLVSVTRQDMDLVVTEHGVANLRHKTPAARAEALIAIAAPGQRDALANRWAQMAQTL